MEKISKTNKPIIISSGGCNISHVDKLVHFFDSRFCNFALMHCVSIYPTPNEKLEGGANDFRIIFDFEKLFSGIDFNTEKFTKAGGDEIGLAQKVLANYSTAFSFEK